MSMPYGVNLLLRCPNNVFVETGSYRGDAIQLAVEAGFKQIYSLDIDPNATEYCENRFPTHPHIHLINASSYGDGLWNVIKDINEPITFWLDAHWMLFEGTDQGEHPWPLLSELEQISRHPIKTHTILIDDMLIMQDDIVGYNRQDVRKALLKINPEYQLIDIANPLIKNILLAKV